MRLIKIIMAGLLLVCLLPMPYGYYTLVRFISIAVFAFLAFTELAVENKLTPKVFTFGMLALLFQPFVKVALGRAVWNILDVVVTVFLVYLWLKERNKKEDKSLNLK